MVMAAILNNLNKLGAFRRTDFMYFYIKSSIEIQGEVGRLQKCFKYLVVYFSDRSKSVFPLLVLLFVALWFLLRGDLF